MALYDNDLNIVAEYTYDSWGKLLSVTGSLAETVAKPTRSATGVIITIPKPNCTI